MKLEEFLKEIKGKALIVSDKPDEFDNPKYVRTMLEWFYFMGYEIVRSKKK